MDNKNNSQYAEVKKGKGGNPSPVSRKGVPNKATKELKDMILGALDDAGGQSYLAQQAFENPSAFMSLIGRVLPKEIKADVEHSGVVATLIELVSLK